MSACTCNPLGDVCARCDAAISEAEDIRDGVDFDPSGRMADAAADECYGGVSCERAAAARILAILIREDGHAGPHRANEFSEWS
jgi:hypothetical protein